jgi:hypothetical protein
MHLTSFDVVESSGDRISGVLVFRYGKIPRGRGQEQDESGEKDRSDNYSTRRGHAAIFSHREKRDGSCRVREN